MAYGYFCPNCGSGDECDCTIAQIETAKKYHEENPTCGLCGRLIGEKSQGFYCHKCGNGRR